MDLPVLLVAAVVVLVALVAAALYWRAVRGRGRRGTFALLGASGAGKTTLFFQLTRARFVPCHTSMHPNIATTALASELHGPGEKRARAKPVHLVDLPGHEKLRYLLGEWEQQLGGVVFVVDAAAFAKEFRRVAEYLYDVLSSEHIMKARVPVLVACSKTDVAGAQPAHRVQATLEDEFTQLRQTRSAAPARQADDGGGGERTATFLGYEDRKFAFADLENEVSFVECAVAKGGESIRLVEEWIRTVYPC